MNQNWNCLRFCKINKSSHHKAKNRQATATGMVTQTSIISRPSSVEVSSSMPTSRPVSTLSSSTMSSTTASSRPTAVTNGHVSPRLDMSRDADNYIPLDECYSGSSQQLDSQRVLRSTLSSDLSSTLKHPTIMAMDASLLEAIPPSPCRVITDHSATTNGNRDSLDQSVFPPPPPRPSQPSSPAAAGYVSRPVVQRCHQHSPFTPTGNYYNGLSNGGFVYPDVTPVSKPNDDIRRPSLVGPPPPAATCRNPGGSGGTAPGAAAPHRPAPPPPTANTALSTEAAPPVTVPRGRDVASTEKRSPPAPHRQAEVNGAGCNVRMSDGQIKPPVNFGYRREVSSPAFAVDGARRLTDMPGHLSMSTSMLNMSPPAPHISPDQVKLHRYQNAGAVTVPRYQNHFNARTVSPLVASKNVHTKVLSKGSVPVYSTTHTLPCQFAPVPRSSDLYYNTNGSSSSAMLEYYNCMEPARSTAPKQLFANCSPSSEIPLPTKKWPDDDNSSTSSSEEWGSTRSVCSSQNSLDHRVAPTSHSTDVINYLTLDLDQPEGPPAELDPGELKRSGATRGSGSTVYGDIDWFRTRALNDMRRQLETNRHNSSSSTTSSCRGPVK